MTSDKTQGEGNRLIAEFDGWKKEGNRYVKSGSYMAEDGEHEWERSIKETEFSYHKNWSLLMPVVEKIHSIPPNRFVIDNNESKIIGDTKIKVFNQSKILSVWECAVKFIQWYKLNSK